MMLGGFNWLSLTAAPRLIILFLDYLCGSVMSDISVDCSVYWWLYPLDDFICSALSILLIIYLPGLCTGCVGDLSACSAIYLNY